MNLNKKKILNNKLLITLLVLFISVSCEKNHYDFSGVIKDGVFCNTYSDCNDGMICIGEKHECIKDPCIVEDSENNICGADAECRFGWLDSKQDYVLYCECIKDTGCKEDGDNLCPSDRCKVNGECHPYEDKSKATCDCDPDYINIGFNCVAKDPCSDKSVCSVRSGHGSCSINEKQEAVCNCNENYIEIDKRCVFKESLLSHIFGSNGNETINDMAVDKDGNIILVGSFNLSDEAGDKLQFTDSSYPAICLDSKNKCLGMGKKDIFILKIGKNGIDNRDSWIQTFGSTEDDEATTVTIDDGYIYVGGYYSNKMSIPALDFYELPPTNNKKNTFIVKINSSNGIVDNFTYFTGGDQSIKDITIYKKENNKYLAIIGSFITSINIKTKQLDSLGESDIFIASLELNNFTYDWAHLIGSNKGDMGNALTIIKDSKGNDSYLALIGSFCREGTFGNCKLDTTICSDGINTIDCGIISTEGSSDILVAKVNLINGLTKSGKDDSGYIKTFGSSEDDEGVGIISYYIPNQGSYLYLAGIFNSGVDIGIHLNAGIFLRHFKDGEDLDSNEEIIQVAKNSNFFLNQIAMSTNNIFLVGHEEVNDQNNENVGFVYSVNNDFNKNDIKKLSFAGDNSVKSIVIDKNDYKYIAGEFKGLSLPQGEGYPYQKETNRSSEGGENDIFFMKYSSDYPPRKHK